MTCEDLLDLAKTNVRSNLITTYRYQRGNYKNYKPKLLSLVPDGLTRRKATNCSLGGPCATLGKKNNQEESGVAMKSSPEGQELSMFENFQDSARQNHGQLHLMLVMVLLQAVNWIRKLYVSLATSTSVILWLHESLISNVQEVRLKATILNNEHISKNRQSPAPQIPNSYLCV